MENCITVDFKYSFDPSVVAYLILTLPLLLLCICLFSLLELQRGRTCRYRLRCRHLDPSIPATYISVTLVDHFAALDLGFLICKMGQ